MPTTARAGRSIRIHSAARIVEGAERRDTDRLAHLRPVDGVYRIRLADELQEIDRVDDVALLVVDHTPGSMVLATREGRC